MSTNEPLKPCPFGCVGERRMNGNHFSASFWVSCEACCIRGRIARYPEDAAEYWNRRPAAIPTGEGLALTTVEEEHLVAIEKWAARVAEKGLGDPNDAVIVFAKVIRRWQALLQASSTGAQAEGKA